MRQKLVTCPGLQVVLPKFKFTRANSRVVQVVWVMCLSVLVSISLANADNEVTELESLEVYPASFQIRGGLDPLQLIVTGLTAGQAVDVTQDCEYHVIGDQVTVSESGLVHAIADGQATIKISRGKQVAQMKVTVVAIQQHQPISFDYDVLPVLAQAGCSGGSCHGAPHGKAGFRLSLFGSDRELDRLSLTRELFGRRINPIEPAKSLILQKPSMQLAHQGGKRFSVKERPYRVLHDWIAEGCMDENSGAQCTGIEVFPSRSRLLKFPSPRQQFSVIASFDDGSQRDVTQLAKYEVSDPLVAEVDRAGLVTGLKRGESAVIVRYLSFIDTPLLTFVRDISGFQWTAQSPVNEVDVHVQEKLKKLQFLPASLCADHEFVRRVFLDAIGILPTEQESSQFIADPANDKRTRLIDQLLQRKEFAKFWAQKWGDLLRVSTKLIGTASTHKFNRWLESSVLQNQRYDEFARDILLATGSTRQNPAGNFYRSAGDTSDAMETAAQVFLGTRIQCAKCHNHPYERWTQENYYGLSAFFNRLERSRTSRKEEVLLWSRDTGEVNLPTTGAVARPWVPVAGQVEGAEGDRRHAFADWLTAADNPLFARVEVNRIWTQLMGLGVVEPFDDFRDSNPAANAPLLDALEKKFIASGYDRKQIIRLILNSNTYQASSQTEAFADGGIFADGDIES